jgi:hypothetical protein
VFDVNPDIEPVVIPIRMVIAAPLPVGIKSINVAIYLAAMFPVFRGVAIDPSPIGLKAPTAIGSPVLVGERRLSHRKGNSHRQRGSENESNYLLLHEVLLRK